MADPVISSIGAAATDVINRLVLAAIFLLLGFVVGRISGKLAQRMSHEFRLDKNMPAFGISLEDTLGSAVSFFIYVVFIVFALNQLSATAILLNMVAIFIVVILLLSFSLSIKDFVPNLLAGFVLRHRMSLSVGNVIAVGKDRGRVIGLTLTDVRLETEGGDNIFIPNAAFTKEKVRIVGKGGKKGRYLDG